MFYRHASSRVHAKSVMLLELAKLLGIDSSKSFVLNQMFDGSKDNFKIEEV